MRNLSPGAAKRQYEAQRRIHREKLEQINIAVPKGKREDYKALAAARGVSLAQLITGYLDRLEAEERAAR